ncbi:MAG: hypothetical protein C0614_13280 [Desulfuromonas sp.]|nr:MAG: hypothetical protein C0614_13280 [Desulfuromonas sp.]
MRNWLEYLPFITVATLVRALPRSIALSLGRRLGALGRLLQPKRVAITDDNLHQALPELSAEQRKVLIREVFANLGLGFIEMLRLDLFDGKNDLDRLFSVEGEEHLREAMAMQRGCILLTGHLGFWEAGNFVFPVLGLPTAVVAKPMRNPLVDAYFRRLRQSYGAYLIDSKKGARRIFKALQQNHAVGILMDQHIKKSEAVSVPFFGRPAHTTPIIAQIAIKHRVPIVPAFAYRNADDSYRVVISPPFMLEGEPSPENVYAATTRLTRCIEDGVREDLGQWFWVHRRWRSCCRSDHA